MECKRLADLTHLSPPSPGTDPIRLSETRSRKRILFAFPSDETQSHPSSPHICAHTKKGSAYPYRVTSSDRLWAKGLTEGLKRASYFGRYLITQAMYFGRLRYWLYSIRMLSKVITEIVQKDADVLWWAREPTLEEEMNRV